MKVWKDNLLTWPHCGEVWVPIPEHWTWLCKLFWPEGWWYTWDKQRHCACLPNWLCPVALQWSSGMQDYTPCVATVSIAWVPESEMRTACPRQSLIHLERIWIQLQPDVYSPTQLSRRAATLLLMGLRIKGCCFKSTSLRWLVLWHHCVNKCHTVHGWSPGILLLLFFSFIFISWRLITLQYCSGFCHTLTWISHGFTCIPHPDAPSRLPLYLILLTPYRYNDYKNSSNYSFP